MQTSRCYLALGSNVGESELYFAQVLELLKKIDKISHISHSKWYQTTPVNCISDRLFLNGVISFDTILPIPTLFAHLEEIEYKIGKTPKAKDAPRRIDLDLLFYGTSFYSDEKITIPHPRWYQRLFVVKPLHDLTSRITLTDHGFSLSINIETMLSFLAKETNERVILQDDNGS